MRIKVSKFLLFAFVISAAIYVGCHGAKTESQSAMSSTEERIVSLQKEVTSLRQQLTLMPANVAEVGHHVVVLHDTSQPQAVVADQEKKNCKYVCDDFYCCQWGPSGESPGTAKCLAYNPRCHWECK